MKKLTILMGCLIGLGFSLGSSLDVCAEYKLVWDKPAYSEEAGQNNKPDGYRIYYGTTKTGLNNYIEVSGYDTEEIALSQFPLTSSNDWYFAMKAFNAAGESEFSNSAYLSDTPWPYSKPDPPSLRLVDQ